MSPMIALSEYAFAMEQMTFRPQEANCLLWLDTPVFQLDKKAIYGYYF